MRPNRKYHADQFLLPLTQTVTVETPHSMICIPDRDTAECELTRLRHEYGEGLIKATIRKDRGSRRGGSIWAAPGTYTLNYTTRQHETRRLF